MTDEKIYSPIDKLIQGASFEDLTQYILMEQHISLDSKQISALDLKSHDDDGVEQKIELYAIFLSRLQIHLDLAPENQTRLSTDEQKVLNSMIKSMQEYVRTLNEKFELEKNHNGRDLDHLTKERNTKNAELANLNQLAKKRGIENQSPKEIHQKIDNGFNKYLFIASGPLMVITAIVMAVSGATVVGIPVAVFSAAFLYALREGSKLNKDYEVLKKISDCKGVISRLDESIVSEQKKAALISGKTDQANLYKEQAKSYKDQAQEFASKANSESSSLQQKNSNTSAEEQVHQRGLSNH